MFLPPFSLLEKLLVGKNVQASVIRLLVGEIIRNSPFDEAAYLEANPDVAAAVESGGWPSGRAHFAATGYFEGRATGPAVFSEDWYLAAYPDVREAVEKGEISSAEDHYFSAGMAEWRSPTPEAVDEVEQWQEALTPRRGERQSRFLELNPIAHETWQTQSQEVTNVALMSGTLSPKGDLLLGRNGFVFLIGGADSPLPEYGRPAEGIAAIAEELVQLFERRRARLAARGIGYLQFIIPEKMSVVPDLFPAEIKTPVPLLSSVEQRIENSLLKNFYFSCFDLFMKDADRLKTYRPVDTHLAPYGAYRLMQGISQFLGLAPLPELIFDRQRITGADVSERFYSMLESYGECDEGWAAPAEKIYESRVTLGHFGKRQSWKCDGAPNAMKILVCGNSYVEFAEHGQYALSWWFSRLFKGYEFIWTSELDWDLVEACRPDFVVCQTVERFLHHIPSR